MLDSFTTRDDQYQVEPEYRQGADPEELKVRPDNLVVERSAFNFQQVKKSPHQDGAHGQEEGACSPLLEILQSV